jgi:acetyl-CoA/propionyl-CoA carboxylase biotin carboxyl carrier protein
VYSEDPYEGFLPSGGLIGNFAAPSTEDTVNDFAIESGTFVPPTFDPMLGKISCWAPTRLEAISLLRKALSNTVLLGVTTNIDFLVDLLEEPNVINGLYDTSYIEKLNLARPQATEIVFDSFALAVTSANLESNTDGCAWTTDNWRLSGSPTAEIAAYLFGERTNVSVKNLPSEFTNQLSTYLVDQDCWIHHPSFGTWKFRTISNHRSRPEGKNADEITSPMPGTVISTNVSVGDRVSTGDSLIIIEAMKMEHVIKAKQDGVIQAVNVSVGLNIKAGEVLLEMSDGA